MKKLILLLVACVTIVGCEDYQPTADQVIQQKQSKTMREAQRQTGLPSIKNFQEKKMLKMLYELRDQENLVCHAYLFNQMTGKVGQYLGKCIGYGLPASTQYSNPEKIIRLGVTAQASPRYYSGQSPSTMPQAEPNGLFMPEGLSATWLMMVDDSGTARPVYVEPQIIVSPFKLH